MSQDNNKYETSKYSEDTSASKTRTSSAVTPALVDTVGHFKMNGVGDVSRTQALYRLTTEIIEVVII